MSRSTVVIENNLKPSHFGKLPSVDNEDDFDEVYENPLDKSKPLPPCPAGPSEELSRYEPESMEFSNPSMVRQEAEAGPEVQKNVYSSVGRNDEASPGTSDFGNSKIATPEALVESIEDLSRSPETSGSKERLTEDSNEKERANRVRADLNFRTIVDAVKSLDANRYATKKTIAQGMLDIALLTANASQLKYILQVGKQHEFYTLMLSLICISIGLQVLGITMGACLAIMDLGHLERRQLIQWTNHAALATATGATFCDVIKMTFGLDPALLQGIICILLGSTFNINKQQDQRKANIWNNICLTMMLLTVGVNAVISAFDMRDINTVQAPSGKVANTQGSGVR